MAFLRDTSLFCVANITFPGDENKIVGSICMVTSSVGFFGAFLQLKSLWKYRHTQRRWPSADFRIIWYLALFDLIACLGVFILAVHFIKINLKPVSPDHFAIDKNPVYSFEHWITALESITIFSYLATYIWTFAYALDMCFQVFRIECSMISYHIPAWLIPLELVALIQGFNYGKYPDECEQINEQISRLILSYFLVPCVIVGNISLLTLAYKRAEKLVRLTRCYTSVERKVLAKFKRKLFQMVLVFIICWVANVVTVIYDVVMMRKLHNEEQYFIPGPGTPRYLAVYVESILNPLQGMFNYVIYRDSFRVTSTARQLDAQVLSPSVRARYLSIVREKLEKAENYIRTSMSTKQNVQTNSNESRNCDERTQLLVSSCNEQEDEFICRLLGK